MTKTITEYGLETTVFLGHEEVPVTYQYSGQTKSVYIISLAGICDPTEWFTLLTIGKVKAKIIEQHTTGLQDFREDQKEIQSYRTGS